MDYIYNIFTNINKFCFKRGISLTVDDKKKIMCVSMIQIVVIQDMNQKLIVMVTLAI